MRFICAAVLAPAPRKLPPHAQWKLRYRVVVQSASWTPRTLEAAALDWNRAAIMHSTVLDWNEIPAKQADVRTLRQFFQSPTATLDELELHATTLGVGESSHPPHQHPNEELVIIKEGTVEALVRGEWKRVGPGSVIFQCIERMARAAQCRRRPRDLPRDQLARRAAADPARAVAAARAEPTAARRSSYASGAVVASQTPAPRSFHFSAHPNAARATPHD
jgi:hypothetical protein